MAKFKVFSSTVSVLPELKTQLQLSNVFRRKEGGRRSLTDIQDVFGIICQISLSAVRDHYAFQRLQT